jgi:hypothetical protein
MVEYPAARRLAQQAILGEQDGIEDALRTFSADYRATFGAPPCGAEVETGRRVLEDRLVGRVPDLPPSASSSGWHRIPVLDLGVPDKDRTR